MFDLVARRFIAAFYPDCKFATTTVSGRAADVEFKTSGRQILEPGWRVVFASPSLQDDKEGSEAGGEQQVHNLQYTDVWTRPPLPYTEATLLRAMETAGKLVDNDELRDALKENGIGRPSTRAAIIETLFKRNYIRKEKKNLIATPTGVELIQTIREELLKSAELTGIWEKKLREIERRTYDASRFLEELKQMVTEIVTNVLADRSNRRIAVQASTPQSPASPAEKPKKAASTAARKPAAKKKKAPAPVAGTDAMVGQPCPLCGKGTVIKGKTAYGCSRWKEGCTFRKPFGK